MATIHDLAALHNAIAEAIEKRRAAGDAANYGTEGRDLMVAVDSAEGKFTLGCRARIQEAAAEYDQQAVRIAELEAEVARLRAFAGELANAHAVEADDIRQRARKALAG
jgi:hypothetical protein